LAFAQITLSGIFVGLARTAHKKIRRIWIRGITVSVNGNFRPYPYPYDRTLVFADHIYTPYVRSKPHIRRIWTVFAGGVQFPATAVFFALFGQFSFLAPLLTELFLCFLYLLMHVFCINR
jgi:hypothetical protein